MSLQNSWKGQKVLFAYHSSQQKVCFFYKYFLFSLINVFDMNGIAKILWNIHNTIKNVRKKERKKLLGQDSNPRPSDHGANALTTQPLGTDSYRSWTVPP